MSRGFTIRIDRVIAMRALAARIREKNTEFEKARKAYPKQFRADKKAAIRLLDECKKKLSCATKVEETSHWSEVDWKTRNNLFGPSPVLNVCSERHALQMLEMDTRKIVSVNSNSELWAMLEGKCEVVRA